MSDVELMHEALKEAEKAAFKGEVPVGAVVSKNGFIVGRGHNLRETEKNALYHAEIIAIDNACKALGGWRLWECDIFITMEPCPMCAGAIINSRIKRVIYGSNDEKSGCAESVANIFDMNFNHKPQIVSGFMQNESKQLIKTFFADLREKKKKERLNKCEMC